MKIALVLPGGVDRSGEVRVIPAFVSLIGRLAAMHEIHVFATHQEPEAGTWMLEGALVHNVGSPRTAWRTAKAILREHRARRFDVVHAFWSGRHGALAVGIGKLLRVPSVVHVAGGELADIPDIGYGGCRTLRGRASQRAVLRAATVVTCASRPVADQIAKRGVAAHIVSLGVDVKRWPPLSPRRRGAAEQPRLVHVASLNGVKDHATSLRALCRLADAGRDFHVDIVGEDTLGGRVHAQADELGLGGRVHFHGFLTQRSLRPIVESAHVALVTSRHEAGPVALLEAAVAGVPTVGTAVGHVADWSPHAALAVPCGDPGALANAIATVLDDEELRLKLAWAAQRIALRDDADHSARLFDEIYRGVAERRATRAGAGRSADTVEARGQRGREQLRAGDR